MGIFDLVHDHILRTGRRAGAHDPVVPPINGRGISKTMDEQFARLCPGLAAVGISGSDPIEPLGIEETLARHIVELQRRVDQLERERLTPPTDPPTG